MKGTLDIPSEREKVSQEELVSHLARLLEHIDSETLDLWEREQYNRLKLEQETKDEQ